MLAKGSSNVLVALQMTPPRTIEASDCELSLDEIQD
jgi:hypothetical protein